MSWPAPCPSDTIVVTAAMPMTTPRTVSPERSLFLPSVRKEMSSRSNKSTGLPRSKHAFCSRHNRLAIAKVPADNFRGMVIDQPEGERDGAQLLVLDPDNTMLAFAG